MSPSKQKPDYEAVLQANIDQDFALYACGKNAPNEDTIRAFEQEIGFALPDEFREFSISPLGGLCIEVKEEVWPRAEPGAIGPFWSFLYGLYVFGFGKDIPEWVDIRIQTSGFRKDTKTALVPFLKRLTDPDLYCFNADGTVCRWDHETGESPAVEKSFAEVFAFEVQELRKRKDRKKAEHGAPPNAGFADAPPASVS